MIRIIISIILFIAAGSVFFAFTKTQYDDVQVQTAASSQYDAALAQATQLDQVRQALLAKYNAIDPADLARLQKMMPDHVDNIGLILDLNSVASHYGMPLQNVDVSMPNAAPASTAQSPAGTVPTQIGAQSNKKYDDITVKFTTAGSYSSFTQFMTALQESLRISDLVDLTIAPNANGIYTYTITLRTYWLKS